MPQKGYPKVRTGCLTCKKRKVKCDEARPYCNRCIATSRKCDGYSYAPSSHGSKYSWEQLLAPRIQFALGAPGASSTSTDGRAMAYFHATVAKTFSRMLGGTNWAPRLSQMAQSEPAVQHAALAISAMYEQRYEKPLGNFQWPGESKSAIQHYNAAIRCIIAKHQSYSLDTLLLVCAMFVCIEFLRGDAGTAISHIRSGILILKSQQVESELGSIFYHWYALPFVFGIGTISFPLIQRPKYLTNASFKALTQAQEIIDRLAIRALHLGQAGDGYRLGAASDAQVSPMLSHEQHQLQVALHIWWLSFSHLQQSSELSTGTDIRIPLLEMQWLVWKVYISSCLSLRETIYDTYMDYFQRILQNATALGPCKKKGGFTAQPVFDIGMGYFTSVYFVVVSCRHLKMRLTALQMLKVSSQSKEMMWDMAIFYAVGKRLIEIEHGITLTGEAMKEICQSIDPPEFPPDSQRIRGYFIEPGATQKANGDRQDDRRQMLEHKVRFIMRDVENSKTSEHICRISVARA
ncbi:uncharacterized protein TRUGW13939_10675 [Talaromyces rugulosus]|uniref:Zn(2)-C6 fungal-type domain-containing protein n=1 Tax=Talaromyces rugulosus TaxID=121627 RepID=A0A7H8RAP8_TALRU|nr:uncharacterized protein TRUGW13939_10675 [Talaromyces rugulosus]QKX63504.1 hypothetical protein TRUGW13939_10675 [Talaromyces rugulosus]